MFYAQFHVCHSKSNWGKKYCFHKNCFKSGAYDLLHQHTLYQCILQCIINRQCHVVYTTYILMGFGHYGNRDPFFIGMMNKNLQCTYAWYPNVPSAEKNLYCEPSPGLYASFLKGQGHQGIFSFSKGHPMSKL